MVPVTREGLPFGGGGPIPAGPVAPIIGTETAYPAAKTEAMDKENKMVANTAIRLSFRIEVSR